MRHACQSAEGGRSRKYVPLESKARMVLNWTDAYVRQTGSVKDGQYAFNFCPTDLFDKHDVSVSRDYLTKLSDKIGELAKKF
ncbi:MAG: hypothetical protein LBP22_06390 [Deltaproteobacteria bacterium]|jgi:hypothetical protein|nr:hypothetical protein [Deltaproteobacteria bacterium]